MSRIETLPLKRLTRQQLLDRFIGLPLRLRWALGPSRRTPQTQLRTGADPALQRLAVSVNALAHQAVDLIRGGANSELPTLQLGADRMTTDRVLTSIQRDTKVIANELSGERAAELGSPDGRRFVCRLRSVTMDIESEIAVLGARRT